MDELFNLSGKVAVITGGAGEIGRAIALAFAERGADIVVTSRNINKLEEVAKEVRGLSRKALAVTCDVTDEQSVNNMVSRVVKEFSRIDILVNAAGAALRKAALDTTSHDWSHIIELNSLGTFLCCKIVGKVMVGQKGGKIINISSLRGRFGTPSFGSAYCPSKGAVDSLTRTLACEFGQYNIHVNALAPSVIKTELSKTLLEDPVRAKNLSSQAPLGRIAELSDVIGPVVFLATDASNFITGQILYVDGGTSCGIMR